jgi:hypothetical protein
MSVFMPAHMPYVESRRARWNAIGLQSLPDSQRRYTDTGAIMPCANPSQLGLLA